MKKLLAAIFAGLFAISMTAPAVAQDKKKDQTKATKKDGSGEGKKAKGDGKKADGKKKSDGKKKAAEKKK